MKKRALAMVMTAVMSVMTLGGCGADSATTTTTAATAEISSAAETTATETESETGLLAKIKDPGNWLLEQHPDILLTNLWISHQQIRRSSVWIWNWQRLLRRSWE